MFSGGTYSSNGLYYGESHVSVEHLNAVENVQ